MKPPNERIEDSPQYNETHVTIRKPRKKIMKWMNNNEDDAIDEMVGKFKAWNIVESIQHLDHTSDRDYRFYCEDWSCPLYWANANKNNWHAVTWLMFYFKEKTFFSHITPQQVSESLKGYSAKTSHLSMLNHVMHDHGFFCLNCKKAVGKGDYIEYAGWVPFVAQWEKYGVCKECFAKIKVAKEDIERQRFVRHDIYEETIAAQKLERMKKESERMVVISKREAEWRAKKEKDKLLRREERHKRKILEKASYELVREMGLLENLEIADGEATNGNIRFDFSDEVNDPGTPKGKPKGNRGDTVGTRSK